MTQPLQQNTSQKLLWLALATTLLVHTPCRAQTSDRFQQQRTEMVAEFIEAEGVTNSRVLSSMRTTPRHEFMPTALRTRAYTDAAWPIGYKQTISPPYVVAYMTETIDPQPDDRVLEIGTGSGYQAAVLSPLVKEVYTIEIVKPLGKLAAHRLKRLKYKNVFPKIGDGYKGWPEHAPFDKIIVTCSPEKVPEPLVQQLKEGGKLIVPLGERYEQVFYLFEKQNGKLERTQLIPTLFVPMTGVSEEKREVQPDAANPTTTNGSFELDTNNDSHPEGWHYLRQGSLVSENSPVGQQHICFQNEDAGRSAQALQGIAVDGRKVRFLGIKLWAKYENTERGLKLYQKPALIVHYYDNIRRPIGESVIGNWLGTEDWRQYKTSIRVPAKTREIVVRIGLLGATGTLCVDDIQIQSLTP